MVPHKHAAVIHAYADGAKIQKRCHGIWEDVSTPSFTPTLEYRVKPEPKSDGQCFYEAWMRMRSIEAPIPWMQLTLKDYWEETAQVYNKLKKEQE